jgi:Rab-GTPase-TBC domain
VDTFYCFSILMSELKENFSKQANSQMEHDEVMKERIRVFADLLKKADSKLHDHL